MDRLLNIAEVSVGTNVPVPTLRYHRHKGIGPRSFKLAGRLVYKEKDVEAWIEAQYANAEGPDVDTEVAGVPGGDAA